MTVAAARQPVIVAATMTGGHDGRAEAVLDVRYPNGAVRSVTVTEEVIGDAVRAAGVQRLDELCGHPWTVLLPAAAPDDRRVRHRSDDHRPDQIP